MNIDHMISNFDFDQFKSDCFIHVSLKTYLEKKSMLSSSDAGDANRLNAQFNAYTDALGRCLKNALCFPEGCKDCVGMQKCANCLKQDDLGDAFAQLHKYF